MLTTDKLPDSLNDRLHLLFVGTAAGKASAKTGSYYAHPGNRFWSTLYEVGLTPHRYEPHEFKLLRELGIGFTDLCKSDAGMDHQISKDAIDVAAFEAKLRKHRPKTIAFTSKKAASLFLKVPTGKMTLGLQKNRFDSSAIFVLPSTSGMASSHWSMQPWLELATYCASIR